MIDDQSDPGSWQRAIDRGCLSQSIARCKACGATDRACPDPVFTGIIPSDGPVTTVATSRAVNGSDRTGLSQQRAPR